MCVPRVLHRPVSALWRRGPLPAGWGMVAAAPAVAETAPLVIEFVINPNGKSEVCILHEYMQRVLKVRPVYNFFECGECDLPHLTPKASSTSLGSLLGRWELTVIPLCWVGTRGEVEGDQMVTSPHPLPTAPLRVEGLQPCNGHKLSSGRPHHSLVKTRSSASAIVFLLLWLTMSASHPLHSSVHLSQTLVPVPLDFLAMLSAC